MKLAISSIALAVAGVCSSAQAAQIQGKVTNEQGTGIAGTVVSIDGGNKTTTNQQGMYQLTVADNSHIHLHVSNSDYIHTDKDLHIGTGTTNQDFSLASSPEENIMIVTAAPFERSALESATPVSVLTADDLKLSIQPTLGDTLEKLPGVQTSHFGSGASRPIIRGMDGPRVKVLENGLSVGDASTVSADHAVTAEAASAQQIEVLRGPGTLLYGNGAIGGVVNVVDKRFHETAVDGVDGQLGARYDTASNGRTINGDINGGNGSFNWHADGTHRVTDNVDIPGNAIEDLPNTHGTIANSQLKLDDFAAGVGYTGDDSYISLSGAHTTSNYGIPGRGEVGAPNITIDLKKTAWQLHGGLLDPIAGFTKLRFDAGYTDYQHGEQEDGDADTFFFNKLSEYRLSMNNSPWGEWQGTIGLHASHRDFSVVGAESIAPNSITNSLAAFIVQERKVEDVRFQLGGRIERYRLTPDNMTIESLAGDQDYQPNSLNDNDVTLSAGLIWDFDPSYNLGLSLTKSQRSGTTEELYFYGPHDATESFEVGSQFDIDNGQVTPNSGDVKTEEANNIDLTIRKLQGSWTGSLSMAYNKVNNFFYERDTGLIASDLVGPSDEGALPVFQFTQGDVDLFSLEAQATVPFNDNWSLDVFSDYTQGKLVDGGNLPRISPMRIGSTLNFDMDEWHADFGAISYAKQTDTGENETNTDGYTLADISITYNLDTATNNVLLYLKGTNIFDAEARAHTSLLKEFAPLMGRNFVAGVTYSF